MSRWFVLGNGPSLAETNLDLLIGENTVALNRINLIYPTTEWRPTIYVKTDHNPRLVDIYNDENKLNVGVSEKSYLWDEFKNGDPEKPHRHLPVGMGNNPKVTWVPRCEHHYAFVYSKKRAQSWHLPEICTAFSGIGPAMQVAVLNGATEIYLLGCDLGYGNEIGHDHFSTDYSLNTKKLTKWDIDNVSYCHAVAKHTSGVPIFNATVGGSLELHERVSFDELF